MDGVVSHCMVKRHQHWLHVTCTLPAMTNIGGPFEVGETTVSVLLIGNADAILCRGRDLEHLPWRNSYECYVEWVEQSRSNCKNKTLGFSAGLRYPAHSACPMMCCFYIVLLGNLSMSNLVSACNFNWVFFFGKLKFRSLTVLMYVLDLLSHIFLSRTFNFQWTREIKHKCFCL